jgi:hypothetical protein
LTAQDDMAVDGDGVNDDPTTHKKASKKKESKKKKSKDGKKASKKAKKKAKSSLAFAGLMLLCFYHLWFSTMFCLFGRRIRSKSDLHLWDFSLLLWRYCS